MMNFFYLMVVFCNVIWIHDNWLYYIAVGAAFASNIVSQIFKHIKLRRKSYEKGSLVDVDGLGGILRTASNFHLFDWSEDKKK